VLSILGFFLVNFFSARQRAYEFGILRALGLSAKKVFQLLIGEGALIFLLGLLGGTGIGYALTRMSRPYLNFILSRVMSGTLVYQISMNWESVIILYGIFAIFYVLAIMFALIGLLRTGIHRVMRIGDE
jgi:ABC-type lipoprotein release transport system permease subunit